jgi:phosphotransferase system IIA component
MRDIQDVLEEQKNVEKSQKVIAFDITFLSPETEEELQPSITGSVQVTFNYEENDELVAAEEDEEQDIQIFHINDKDENGERIKNIT